MKGNSLQLRSIFVFTLCVIVAVILITEVSSVVSVSAAAPSITDWSSIGGSPINKDNPQDFIYRVQPEDTIIFTVTANETCNFTWKVMLGAEVLQTHEENNTKTSSFTWQVPNKTSTWDIEVEVSNYKPPIGPYKQDHKVWTITTSELITVNLGEDIQAALDSLPVEGGVVELKEGTWNLSNADTPIQINRSNTTLRGQGKNKTVLHATEILDKSLIWVSTTSDYVAVEDMYLHGFSRDGGNYSSNLAIWECRPKDEEERWDAYTKYSDLLIDNVYMAFQCGRAMRNLIQYCTVEHVYVFTDCWIQFVTFKHNIFRDGGTGAVIKFNGGSDNIFTNNIVEHVAGWAVEPYGICPRVTITNNIIRYVAYSGHGIRMWTYGSLVKGNIIHDANGDGIRVFDCWAYSDPSKNINNITNNLIYNNKGSGITTQVRDTTIYTTRTANIMNNIIYENEKNGITCNGLIENNGVPVYVYNIKNNIITNNKEYGINYIGGISINLSYNDIYNNSLGNYNNTTAGTGDISVDSLFADPNNGDFHLKSQAGRWDGTDWVYDNETSPCIDAGDQNSSYTNETYPHGQRINIGAYGNTQEASKSPYHKIYLSVPMTIDSNGKYSYPKPPITYKDNQTINITFNVSDTTNLTINSYTSSQISFTATNTTTDQKMNITVYNGTFMIINGKKYEIKKDGTVQQTKTAGDNKVVFTDIPVGSDYVITESSDNGYTITLSQGYNMLAWTSTTPTNSSELCNEVPNCSYVYKKNPDGSWTAKQCGYPGGEFTVSRGFGFLAYVTEACEWTRDSTTFKYQRDITITEQSSSDLTDYTVSIKLNSTNFDFTHTKPNGEDIRFKDKNENLLSYFIEEWDATNKNATIWVKVPAIPANSSTVIHMYYGNSEVESASDGEATFEFFDDCNIENAVAINGGNGAVFDVYIYPQAIYHNGKVIITYQGPNLDIYVVAYNSDGEIEGPYYVADNPLTNDAHGGPAIWVDGDGYYHITYGSHGTAQKHAKSTNPGDISSWEAQSDIDPYATYPQIVELDNTLYLFYRAGGHSADWVYRTSTDGGNNWSGKTALFDSTSENVWYVSFRKGKDGKIHVAWVWKDESNLLGTSEPEYYQRYNVYYMYRDNDGNWKNIEGTTLTLPITKTIADSHCLVYQTDNLSPLKHCNEAIVDTTTNGTPFILFVYSDLYGGTEYLWKIAKWSGSSWDINDITSTSCTFSCGSINVIDGNNVEAFIPTGGIFCQQRNELGRGGQIEKWVTTDGGQNWNKDKTIAKSPHYMLIMNSDRTDKLTLAKSNFYNNVHKIKDGTDTFKIIFYSRTPFWDENNKGIFIWGENGFKGSKSQDGYVRAYLDDVRFRGALYTTDYMIDDNIIIEASAEMSNELIMSLISNMQSNGESYSGNVLGEPYNSDNIGRVDFDAAYSSSWLESLADTAFNPELNQKYLLQLIKKMDGYIEFRVNGTSTNATNTIYSGGNPGVGFQAGGSSSATGNIKFWWFRVRKYTDPEPSVSIGSEKTV